MNALIKEIPRWVYWYPFRMVADKVPLPMTYPLVKLTAQVGLYIPQRKFPRMYDGLRKSFPEFNNKDLRSVAYNTFQNYLLNASETFWYPKLNKKRMLKLVDFEGLEHIDQALKLGKGVILAHAHFGNEELLMPAIGYMGYTAHQLASRWEPEEYKGSLAGLVNYIRQKAFQKRIGYRESFPVNFHYVDKGIRPAVRCLQENEILLFAVDGREGTKWMKVDFLGREAAFSPGLVTIAKLTGAVILPVFIVRQPDCRHRLKVHPPIQFNPEDEYAVLLEFVKILEGYIRKNPEQYSKVFFLVQDFFLN